VHPYVRRRNGEKWEHPQALQAGHVELLGAMGGGPFLGGDDGVGVDVVGVAFGEHGCKPFGAGVVEQSHLRPGRSPNQGDEARVLDAPTRRSPALRPWATTSQADDRALPGGGDFGPAMPFGFLAGPRPTERRPEVQSMNRHGPAHNRRHG
jgi:hypothetical protein